MLCKNKIYLVSILLINFPIAKNRKDKKQRLKFIKEAGSKSIAVSSLKKILKKKIVITK